MDGAVNLNLSDGENPQKQIQTLIRAEIAQHHPIKGALRPLEIIAESSVRVVENGGCPRYEIIDEDGVVRAWPECGRPFTIADLVAELRTKHPSLFEIASAQSDPGEHTARSEVIDDDRVVPARPESERPLTIANAVAELRTKHPSLFEVAPAEVAPGEHTARSEVIDDDGVVPARPESERPLTIANAVTELRTKHPSLFVVASAQAIPGEHTEPEPAPKFLAEAPRDLLILSSNEPKAESAEGRPDGPRVKRAWYRGGMNSLAARLTPVASAAAGWARSLKPQVPLSLTRRTSGLLSVRPLYAFAAVSAAVALVILAFIAGRLTTTDEAASEGSAPVAATPTDQAPTTTGTAAPGAAKTRDDISPGAPAALVGVPEVIDTSTLRIEGNLIRLFGVEWARGGQSEDLVRYLRGRATTCRPTGAGNLYRCDVDGRDLSQVVLYNGGGRATADAPPELVAAENHAKAERLGVWKKQAPGTPAAAN
jgi:endonuclease YncB( thermonuclease family)